jgi:hypothetical protein
MTYCIRNATFFDFRWTYMMRTLHNSECSISLKQSLISSHSNHMMTHPIFISGFDTFYCRFLASFMIGLLRFFILMKSSSYGFLQNLTHMLWHSFDIIANTTTRKCIHFSITTTFKHQPLPAMCTSY